MPLYSHSRLAAFEQCPQKYKFRYIDRLDSDRETVEAFLGSRVHEVLEQLYRDVDGGRLPTLEEVGSGYKARWLEKWHPAVVIVREEYSADHYREIGRRCLENYYRRFAPFDQGRTVGLEKRIEVTLDPRREYRLQGFIDRLTTIGDGIYEIHDYKTAKDLPADPADLKDRQLGLYELGIRESHPDVKEVRLIWHFLTHDHDIMITTTLPYRKNLQAETVDLIQQIERAGEFPTKESALCKWCEYMPVCPAKRHEFEISRMGGEDLSKEAGVQLVNDYAEAYRERKALDAKVKLLAERIIQYARARGLTALQGTDCQALLKGGPSPKFVTASESVSEYSALVAFVKKDPALWDRVAGLDADRLLGFLEGNELGDDLKRMLSPFLREKGSVSVRLKYPR